MRSISRVLHSGFVTLPGVGLVMLVNAGAQAQTMASNRAHSSSRTSSISEQARARFSATLDYGVPKPPDFKHPALPPPADLITYAIFHAHFTDKSHTPSPSLDDLERLWRFNCLEDG